MGTIQKRAGKKDTSYTATIRLKGYPTITETFTSKTEAKLWVTKIEKQFKQGRKTIISEEEPKSKPKAKTLNEVIDRFIAEELPNRDSTCQKKYKSQLWWWKKKLGYISLNDLTPVIIAECQNKLQSEPISTKKLKDRTIIKKYRSGSTVNRYTAALSASLTMAVREWGWIPDNPVHKVRKKKEPRGRVRYLTQEERETLLESCKQSLNPYLYFIVILAISIGARSSEITTLTWDKIDFSRKLIYILDTKNGEARSIPISSKIYELLIELKARKDHSKYLFPRKKGDAPIDIRKAWNNALKRAGIANFRFHDLRHTAASYLAMNGATLMELSHILGHKTLQMVKRYAHLTDQHTAALIERMNQKTL